MNLATPVSSGTSWNAAPKTSLFNCYDSLRLMRIFYRRHITIDDAIDSNTLNGYHFFDAFTMEFFNSRVESNLLENLCFVTSEQDRQEMNV